LRIIGGNLKGRKLHKFRGADIRPTADRLRESIFNILGNRIQGKRVLDLFAGTGALGLEALSRGAETAVFIENRSVALALIRRNISTCRMESRSKTIKWDITGNLNCLKPMEAVFNIAFLDPPYGGDRIKPAIRNLIASRSLADGARVIVEHADSESIPKHLPNILISDRRRYGKTTVSILRYMV